MPSPRNVPFLAQSSVRSIAPTASNLSAKVHWRLGATSFLPVVLFARLVLGSTIVYVDSTPVSASTEYVPAGGRVLMPRPHDDMPQVAGVSPSPSAVSIPRTPLFTLSGTTTSRSSSTDSTAALDGVDWTQGTSLFRANRTLKTTDDDPFSGSDIFGNRHPTQFT